MLCVQVPVSVCDCLSPNQTIHPLLLRNVWNHTKDLVPIDGAVDNYMGNMNSEGAELASERLADDTKAGLRGGERGKRRLSAQRCRCTGEDDRASTSLQHHARNFSSEDEAPETADTPHRLEIGALRGQRRPPYRVARIVDADLHRTDRLDSAEDCKHSGFALSIANGFNRATSVGLDLIGY